MLEEITLSKSNLGEIECRLNELLNTVEEDKKKLEAMVNKVVRSDKEVNDLRAMALQLQAKVIKLETDLKR